MCRARALDFLVLVAPARSPRRPSEGDINAAPPRSAANFIAMLKTLLQRDAFATRRGTITRCYEIMGRYFASLASLYSACP